MADAVSDQLRGEIRARAGGRCEYCLALEALLLVGCEVDHIISRKHGGATEFGNLALSCARCNRAKGTDVGSIHPISREFVRLFVCSTRDRINGRIILKSKGRELSDEPPWDK